MSGGSTTGGVIECQNIPNEENVLAIFNGALEAFLAKMASHFPSHAGLQNLAAFASGIVRVDNQGMLIGVRLVLDSFPASVYPLIQNRNDELWSCTKLIGVPIHDLWPHIPPDIKESLWLKLNGLVNAANVVGQIPQQRLVQLNVIIANAKDMLASFMPYIMETVQNVNQEIGQNGGQNPLGGVMSAIISGIGNLSTGQAAAPQGPGQGEAFSWPQQTAGAGFSPQAGGLYHNPYDQMYHPQ